MAERIIQLVLMLTILLNLFSFQIFQEKIHCCDYQTVAFSLITEADSNVPNCFLNLQLHP